MKNSVALKVLDNKISHLPSVHEFARPHRGWIKAIREAIGMTTAQLAHRMGVSQPRITEIESAETHEKLTLASLRRAAEALDCTLVYALIPRTKSLESLLLEQAKVRARTILKHVNHTMILEEQGINQRIEEQINNLALQLIAENSKLVWDEKV